MRTRRIAIIGAGPIGALTAIMAADAGHEVNLIEVGGYPRLRPDQAWSPSTGRTMQQDQPHTLLSPAVETLEKSAPDVLATLTSMGARITDELGDFTDGPEHQHIRKLECRRALLECAFGAALSKRAITRIQGRATELIVDAEGAANGIVLSGRTLVFSDIVIDARGNNSAEMIGLKPRHVRHMPSDLIYLTCWFQVANAVAPRQSVFELPYCTVLYFRADNQYTAASFVLSAADPLATRLRDQGLFLEALGLIPGSDDIIGTPVGRIIASGRFGNRWASSVGPYGMLQDKVVSVGDALVMTNPTFGRGLSLGFQHVARVVPQIEMAITNPRAFGVALNKWERQKILPWFTHQVSYDTERSQVLAKSLSEDSGDVIAGDRPSDTPLDWFATLRMYAKSDVRAATVVSEVKHLRKHPALLAGDPGVRQLITDLLNGADPDIKPHKLPSRSEFSRILR
jgi:2-polyprenyl-6-methoxyphenol hydroxylase-like FAD-dependent oxidoreductase